MLDRLKPAWRLFKMQQAMAPLDRRELLALLEEGEDETGIGHSTPGGWISDLEWYIGRPLHLSLVMFLLLLTCCHGG